MQLNNKEIHKLFIESVRYSLTRHSYAPSECADLIRSKWEEIPDNTRVIIARDVNEAIEEDANISELQLQYKWPDDIRYCWVSLRDFMGAYRLSKSRSSGKHIRSMSEASDDVGSGIRKAVGGW